MNLRTLAFPVALVDGAPQVPATPVTLDDVWLGSINVLPPDSAVRTVEVVETGHSAVTLRWATAPASAWERTVAQTCVDPGRIFNAPRRGAGRD